MKQHYIITVDPPTPNGDLHVGHLSGPYFAADVVTRYLRLAGHEVVLYSNADPHQTYVVTTAWRLGREPAAVAAYYNRRIVETLAADGIELDLFADGDQAQAEFVNHFYADLYRRGKLLAREEPMPFCQGCGRFLFQAYIEGRCPHCGKPCYGNNCEGCCRPNRPRDMLDAVCRRCRQPPSLEAYRGLFLPLEPYREALRAYAASRREVWRSGFFDRIWSTLGEPLPDIPVTFVGEYGLPVAIPGFEGQVFNVTLEIYPALMSTFDRWRRARGDGAWDWRDRRDDFHYVTFVGVDNGGTNAVIYGALAMASQLAWPLPRSIVTNEFYQLNGKKFSSTRNYAVWGGDLLARVSSDQLRFYVAWSNPENEEANFTLAEFAEVTDRLLTRPWNEVHRRLRGLVPAAGHPGRLPEGFRTRLDRLAADLAAAYEVEGLSLRQAARRIAGWLEELRGLPEAAGDLLLPGVKALMVLAQPILPGLAAAVLARLGQARDWQSYGSWRAGEPLGWGEDLSLAPLAEVDLSPCEPKE